MVVRSLDIAMLRRATTVSSLRWRLFFQNGDDGGATLWTSKRTSITGRRDRRYRACFRVIFCHGRVGNARNREGWFGNGAAEKPDGVTLFGNGRERLESPSVSSSPGHPKEMAV